ESPVLHKDRPHFPTRRSSDLESNAKKMEVTSDNGEIRVDGVTGETVKLRADNGRIIFSHADIESSEISTSNGKIELTEIAGTIRSEEHTSELQSRFDIVCRLL